MSGIDKWMSWEGGVDLVAMTKEGASRLPPSKVELKVDGEPVELLIPKVGISGGPAARLDCGDRHLRALSPGMPCCVPVARESRAEARDAW